MLLGSYKVHWLLPYRADFGLFHIIEELQKKSLLIKTSALVVSTGEEGKKKKKLFQIQ